MSSWRLVYSRQAQKDAKELIAASLEPKARVLLERIADDPFASLPLGLRNPSLISLVAIRDVSVSSTDWSTRPMLTIESYTSCACGCVTSSSSRGGDLRILRRRTRRESARI